MVVEGVEDRGRVPRSGGQQDEATRRGICTLHIGPIPPGGHRQPGGPGGWRTIIGVPSYMPEGRTRERRPRSSVSAVAPWPWSFHPRGNAYNDLAVAVKLYDYPSNGRPLLATICAGQAAVR